MKRVVLGIIMFWAVSGLFAQSRQSATAQVDRVLNIPVYMYAYPDQDYNEVETLEATWSAISTGLSVRADIDQRIREIIDKGKNRAEKGKVGSFNGVIINPDDFSGILISLEDKSDLRAKVDRRAGVPIYTYSNPTERYTEVSQMNAPWSALSSTNTMNDIITEILRKARKRERKGKIEHFDAILLSPDNFTAVLIRFESEGQG